MLTVPLPKAKEAKVDTSQNKRGKAPSSYKAQRTPITAFIASKDDLQENEYILHPVLFKSDEEKRGYLERRTAEKTVNGWVDTIVQTLEDAVVPENEVESGSMTAGRTILAIDCEMCMVEGGEYALTRVSVLDWDGEVVMDELVKPDLPITDYLTP